MSWLDSRFLVWRVERRADCSIREFFLGVRGFDLCKYVPLDQRSILSWRMNEMKYVSQAVGSGLTSLSIFFSPLNKARNEFNGHN